MRGTTWANTLQTMVFMVLGVVTFYVIATKLGGKEDLFANSACVVRIHSRRQGDAGAPQSIQIFHVPADSAFGRHVPTHLSALDDGEECQLIQASGHLPPTFHS